ncbi:MAG: FkbM family methyltransferase [Candidatus Dadabacteria bacterium CSP1-2]|nr:MAG: FkbM family methyltransferase [Candidatus Dadabacteria bacterium CSP1-2]
MIANSKKIIGEKLRKLEILLNTPGAFKARIEGCYFELYKMVHRLYAMGLRPNTILDIGANRGMFSKCAYYIFPDASIYAFEPLKDCYEELCDLKGTVIKLECYNIALGDKPSEVFIHRSIYDYSSSLLEMDDLHKQAFPYTAGERLEKVQIQTLDAVLAGKRIERPLLMKIDVQGYEKFVLRGASETLKQTDYIVCEMSFHSLYKGQALFEEVYRLLIDAGFQFRGHIGEVQHPESTEVLQIDGLFIREK